MMSALKNHPGMWLRADAAASLERLEAAHGVQPLTSAGRTEAEQQGLIDRWNRGGTYNRPPYLYEPARPASSSSHVKSGGLAIDTTDPDTMRRIGAFYGWWQPHTWDDVHFEYDPNRDQSRAAAAALPDHKEDPVAIHLHRQKTGVTYTAVYGAYVKQHPDELNGNIAGYLTTGSTSRPDFRGLNDADLVVALYDLGFPELGADLSKLPAAGSKRSPHGYYWCGRGKPGHYS